jgi:hypothetical protein
VEEVLSEFGVEAVVEGVEGVLGAQSSAIYRGFTYGGLHPSTPSTPSTPTYPSSLLKGKKERKMNPIKQLFGVEEPVFDLKDEISFLDSIWRNDEVPLRLRFSAAAEVAKYRHGTMKAVVKVTPNDFASVLDRAKERAASAYNVISLVPKAIEHDAAELKPDVKNSPGANGSAGFRRRF